MDRKCKLPGGQGEGEAEEERGRGQGEGQGTRAAAPTMHVCYICGREYGSASLAIHEVQCLRTFEERQARLPPEQRRRAPRRPGVAGSGAGTVEEQNAAARQAYEERAMVACEGCGRRFNGEDRVAVHMRGCDAAKALAAARGSCANRT